MSTGASRPVRKAGWLRRRIPGTLRHDLVAGVVLGVESVPDGLASGLLAGVNPLAGLYAYLFGMVGAAAFASTSLLTVQATGAMALVVSDAGLETRADPARALFTLSMLAGVVLIIAGILGAGRLVRFVPTAVMTGFLTAVGVNIVLGQLSNFTGYQARGSNRILRALDTFAHVGQWSVPTTAVGALTIVAIILLTRTRLRSLGLVAAVVLGSVAAVAVNLWVNPAVVLLRDLVDVPSALPGTVLPTLEDVGPLLLPAFSLALVCIVQGAGVSASLAATSGTRSNVSRDIIAQGAGNLLSGLFRGMPVGGSLSASSLVVQAGARSRLALFIAGAVMAVVILFASPWVAFTAMPALGGLLIVIGVASIKPSRVFSVFKTGAFQTAVMAVTFVLTLIIPLQYAVLVGVALGIVLFVARQSNRLWVRALELTDDGRMRETDPPGQLAASSVTVLQPYGSLFFASAPNFEAQLPEVTETSTGCTVIIRLRGTDELGLALVDVLRRYAASLAAVGSTMKIVASEARVLAQLEQGGLAADIGAHNIYKGGEWIGDAVRRAYDDAVGERPAGAS